MTENTTGSAPDGPVTETRRLPIPCTVVNLDPDCALRYCHHCGQVRSLRHFRENMPAETTAYETPEEREASEQEAAGLAEFHSHFDQPCEFPTCAGCGGCTEEGGHCHAGRAYCGDCGEKRALDRDDAR